MSAAGPQLPPHLAAKRKRQQEEEAAAVAKAASTSAPSLDAPSAKDSEESLEKKRRTVGPALPPAPISEIPSAPPNAGEDDDSSSDDDIGPSFPGASTSHYDEDEELAAQQRLSAHDPDKPRLGSDGKPELKRDEWMLVPPKQEDWTSRVDPTKIKSRKFQTGKGSKAPQAKGGDNALWTESPLEKQKRLADEVMGVKKPATQAYVEEDKLTRQMREEAEETKRRIEEYNRKNRSQTLYESHQNSKDKEEEDDPSKRAFDREKDIVGSSKKIGMQQKKDMLNRAGDFGSRFSSGSFL